MVGPTGRHASHCVPQSRNAEMSEEEELKMPTCKLECRRPQRKSKCYGDSFATGG